MTLEKLRQKSRERLNTVTLDDCKRLVKTLEDYVKQSVKLRSEPNVINNLANLQRIVNRKNPGKKALKECYLLATVYIGSWKRYM